MAVDLAVAARELGVAPETVRRWVAAGAPAARRGARGRGRRTLVDPAALAAWRRSCAAEGSNRELDAHRLAADLPNAIADAVDAAFRLAEGPHKRASAGLLAAAWFLSSTAVLDRLRELEPDVAELAVLPEKIRHLRGISSGFDRFPAPKPVED